MKVNKELILNTVLEADNHPTADDIYHLLYNSGKKISMATVYNNLNSLVDDGLIHRVTVDGKSEHYDKVVRHDHMVCSVCGKITDLMLDDITPILEEKSGLELESYDLKLFYICNDCKKRRNVNG